MTEQILGLHTNTYEMLSKMTDGFASKDELARIMQEVRIAGCLPFTLENLSKGMIPDFEVRSILNALHEIENYGSVGVNDVAFFTRKERDGVTSFENSWQKKANKHQQTLRSE